MFFCPQCNNSFDIARGTDPSLSGGFDDHVANFTADFTVSSDTLSSDILSSDGGDSISNIINKLLDNISISPDSIANLSVSDFTKHPLYKSLDSTSKSLVFNKLQDLLPKHKKKIMHAKSSRPFVGNAFFVCNNCGYAKKISEGTRIFSRGSDSASHASSLDINVDDMIYNSIEPVPYTRKYNCPNNKCPSHKNPAKREAIFFRLGNSLNIRYICTTCRTSFS